MATKLPSFEEDMDIIQKLGDTPGTDNNLSAGELKARFDKAGNLLKTYLNRIVPMINNVFSGEGNVISGGTLIGDLDMNGNRLLGVRAPAADADAANKKYVDEAAEAAKNACLPTSGGKMTGGIDMADNWLGDLPYPSSYQDAATKGYVDERIVTYQNVSVPASNWNNGTQPLSGGRPYYANVRLDANTTFGSFSQVVFHPDDIAAYNFAPVCEVHDGYIQIYAETAPTAEITIPAIVCWKT